MSKIDYNYMRVLPRDLFNEAKLLKCIGQLCLLIHDCKTPDSLKYINFTNSTPFQIGLHYAGYLYMSNVAFTIGNTVVMFMTTYNSKAEYPLEMLWDEDEFCTVFNSDGSLHEDFINKCNEIEKSQQ